MNTAFTTSAEGQIDTYLGDNNYANVPYFADHNAISPDNSNDMMDSLAGIYTGLLRNTKTLKYTITDQKTDEVYLEKPATTSISPSTATTTTASCPPV